MDFGLLEPLGNPCSNPNHIFQTRAPVELLVVLVQSYKQLDLWGPPTLHQ